MGTSRTSTTGTNYTAQPQRYPVSGRITLQLEAGWIPASLPMENPHPLKACRVRLFEVGDPARTLREVASDYRGRFGFTREELGGRDLGQLGLEVVAWNHGRVRVCHESSETPWSFRVARLAEGSGISRISRESGAAHQRSTNDAARNAP